MRIVFSFLLLLCALRLQAANCFPTGGWINTNGGIMYLVVTNCSTNGTWSSMGLTDNKWTGVEPAAVKFHVTGNGFDPSGAVITARERLLIGTTKYPSLYPATNAFETSADGTVAVLQIAMSDFVFATETVTADIVAGLYTESGKANTATNSLTITNLSYFDYTNARPVFNWITPQFDRSTGSTYRVEFLCAHWSSIYDNGGRPVQAVQMTATDQNSHSVTTTLTTCLFDYNAFGVGGARYAWDVPTASFNDTNIITVQARTLPYFGTNAMIDTSDGVYTAPSPNYCPLKFLNDPSGTYGEAHVNVSKVTGNDGTCIVTNLANWTTNLQPAYTIIGAANAIAVYNSNFFGRKDVGGGHIHLEANTGGYRMGETNLTTGTRPRTYVELLPYPGLARGEVFFYTNHLTTDVNQLVKCSGITFSGAAIGTAVIFSIVDCVWTDDCDWATGQSAPLNIVTNWYSTRDRFYKMTGSLKTAFAATGGPTFVRDALFNWTNTTACFVPVQFRNLHTNAAAVSFSQVDGTSSIKARPCTIWAYNRSLAVSNTSTEAWTLDRITNDPAYIGKAIFGNILEAINNSASTFCSIGADGSSNMFNILLFDNTILQKVNWFYDDGTSPSSPNFYSPSWAVGNYIDDTNIKGDDFTNPNGARYGNRPQMLSVGFTQNLLPETYNIGTPGSFRQGLESLPFYGLNSFSTNNTTGSTNTLFQFANRQSYVTSPGAGNGDYRFLTPSPAHYYVGPRVLSHKQNGPTSAFDAPGAVVGGNARMAGLF